jgi:hypothetical protein
MKRFLMMMLTLLAAAPLAAQADLTIANAKSTPSLVPTASQFVLSFDLRNAGNQAATSPAVKVPAPSGATYVSATSPNIVCVAYQGYLLCTGVSGWTLAASATATVSTMWQAPLAQGSFTSAIVADPDSLIAESREDNNTATIGGSYIDTPRVSAKLALCPSGVRVNAIGGASFVLRNEGNLAIRYPGLKIEVNAARPVIVTHTDARGGTVTGVTYGAAGVSHTFWYTPPSGNIPLAANTAAPPLFVYVKSASAQKVRIRASIDTQAIQDTTTPRDNVATCTYAVE